MIDTVANSRPHNGGGPCCKTLVQDNSCASVATTVRQSKHPSVQCTVGLLEGLRPKVHSARERQQQQSHPPNEQISNRIPLPGGRFRVQDTTRGTNSTKRCGDSKIGPWIHEKRPCLVSWPLNDTSRPIYLLGGRFRVQDETRCTSSTMRCGDSKIGPWIQEKQPPV